MKYIPSLKSRPVKSGVKIKKWESLKLCMKPCAGGSEYGVKLWHHLYHLKNDFKEEKWHSSNVIPGWNAHIYNIF